MNRPIQSRHPLGLFLQQYSACQDVRTKRRAGMLAVGGPPPCQARVRPAPDLRKTRASGLRKTPPTRPRTARPSWPCCVRGRDRSATESVHGIPFVGATAFVFTESPVRRVCNLLESRLASEIPAGAPSPNTKATEVWWPIRERQPAFVRASCVDASGFSFITLCAIV